MKFEKLVTRPFMNLNHHHRQLSRLQRRKNVYFFDQIRPPRGWNGAWNNGLAWTPCRIIRMGGLSSRHKSKKYYTTCIAYTLDGTQSPNPFGYQSPEAQRLLMHCCGPRNLSGCKPGARTCTPCLHVMSTLKLLGVLSHRPQLHKPRFSRLNRLSAGSRLPRAHRRGVLRGYFS